MSMHSGHHTEHHEPDVLWPIWIGVALVAIVAFSYWLNAS